MEIKYSSFGSRICFEPFGFRIADLKDTDPATNKTGIRFHNAFTALALKLLSIFGWASGIIKVNFSGRSIFLNKGSFTKWCARHGSPFSKSENAVEKINRICLSAIIQKKQQQTKKHLKIQEIALKHLDFLSKEVYNSEGELQTNSKSLFYKEREVVFSKDPNAKNNFFNVFKPYHFENDTLYHGTDLETAKIIKQNGFNPLAATNTGTDTGAGSYFAVRREKALLYAKNDQAGLLTCKLNPNLKIVAVSSQGYELFIKGIFDHMVSSYVKSKNIEISNDLGELSILDFNCRLWDLFVRDFFLRSNVDGLYVENSALAGCSYINLFDPQRDLLEIK